MAAFDLEEQEQLDELKAWWNKHGNLVTGIVVLLAVGVIGWQGWGWWNSRQAEQASVLYSELTKAVAAKDVQKARAAAGELLSKFGKTTQADLGALLAARAELDAGDAKGAHSKLDWAVNKANDPLLRDVARLRLASLQLDEKTYDEALKTLDSKPAEPFAARFADLRGDIHFAKGAPAEARKSYESAIELLGKEEGAAQLRSFVELKLEALGEA